MAPKGGHSSPHAIEGSGAEPGFAALDISDIGLSRTSKVVRSQARPGDVPCATNAQEATKQKFKKDTH